MENNNINEEETQGPKAQDGAAILLNLLLI